MRKWLIKIRHDKGFTQEHVASRSFIDRAYYSQIENGVRNPSFETARQIARTLDFNPSIFYMEEISEPFTQALEGSPIVVAHCDRELRYTWIFNPHIDFSEDALLGKRDDEIDENEGIRELVEFKQKIINTGLRGRKVISFPLPGGAALYDVYGKPLFCEKGKIIGAATASTDITHLQDFFMDAIPQPKNG